MSTITDFIHAHPVAFWSLAVFIWSVAVGVVAIAVFIWGCGRAIQNDQEGH